MRFETYYHHDPEKIIPTNFKDEITSIITGVKLRKPIKTQSLRLSILSKLHDLGWSDKFRVDPHNSRIDITSVRSNIGLCFQTGNISRFYADMLKHQTLYADGKIKASICIVPNKVLAKLIGLNIVNFERLVNELNIFSKTITVPILVYGIEE